MTQEDDDRIEAHDRTERYYERMGYDIPDRYDIDYRERFYINLERIREEGRL